MLKSAIIMINKVKFSRILVRKGKIMLNLNEIENDLLSKQQELEEKSNIESEYNSKLSELEVQYNSNVIDLNSEIQRLEGMKQNVPEGSTEEEIDDVNANNEEVDKKIEEVKQGIKSAEENYQNRKNQLEEERKQEEIANEAKRENILESISTIKNRLLEAIEQNREESKQEEENAKKIEEEAYKKFREKNKQIRRTKKNIENLKLSLDSLNKIEGSNVDEAKKQILKAKKSEMRRLKNFARSRTKLWEKYNEAYKNRQQAEKNTENVMKETEELIAKYSLNIEMEKDEEKTEINSETQEQQTEQEQQEEGKKENQKAQREKESILGYTAESLENETKSLKDKIRENFKTRGIEVGTELENKIYKRIENQYMLFDKVLNNPKSSKKQIENMAKEFKRYKELDINDIVKDVLHLQEEFENKEELFKTAEQLGIMVERQEKQTEEKEEIPNLEIKQEQQEEKINFTEEELKQVIQEQKNVINRFFTEKGITDSVIMTKIFEDIDINQKEFIKILKGESDLNLTIKDFNETFGELKKSTKEIDETFKDEKKLGEFIDAYLQELRVPIYIEFDKKVLEKVTKEYNDFLLEAKKLQIPISDSFKLYKDEREEAEVVENTLKEEQTPVPDFRFLNDEYEKDERKGAQAQKDTLEEKQEEQEQQEKNIKFAEEELKQHVQEAKNVMNEFFAKKGTTDSVIKNRIFTDMDETQVELMSKIKEGNISAKDIIDESREFVEGIHEIFRDEKLIGEYVIDIYLEDLLPNKVANEKQIKVYNDFLMEAKKMRIPINNKFKFLEEKSNNTEKMTKNATPVPDFSIRNDAYKKVEKKAPQTAQKMSEVQEIKRWIFDEKDVTNLVNNYQNRINEYFIGYGYDEEDTSELRTQMLERVNKYKNNYTQILRDTDNPEFDSKVINESFYNLQKYFESDAVVLMVANDAINSMRKQIEEKEDGEEKDKLIDKYNNILIEARLFRIPTTAKKISTTIRNTGKDQKTEKIDLEKITFFAKAGLYHFTFSDGTAISINQSHFMDKRKMRDLQNEWMSQMKDIRAMTHQPDITLIDALSSAMCIRNNYFKNSKEEFSIGEINKKIVKYADGVEYSNMGSEFSKILYDNISEMPEINEIQKKSLNSNKEALIQPEKHAKKIINKILKNAKAIKGIEILGPVGRLGKLKYFIKSYILKKCLSAQKRQKQLKEEASNIKTLADLRYDEQKQEFDSNIKATEEQKQEMEKITRQYAEKEQEEDILDGKWKPVEDNTREENE